MKISVIIPVYNVEKYLPKCIQSVLDQTYPDLEIILVDDGSKDKSGAMCDDYAKQDARVRVIHKENGGLSSARNAGIDIASGDAILFLDSDDFIPNGCLISYVNLMEKYDADEVVMKIMYISEDTNDELPDDEPYLEVCMNSEDAIELSLYQRYITCAAPSKLYKRQVIGNIRFPENKILEDLATNHLFLANAHVIVYANTVGYYYRQRNGSILHSFSERRFDALEWAHQIESYCRQYYPKILKASYTRTFNVAVHLLLDIPDSVGKHNSYKKELMAEICRTRKYVMFNRKSRNREKIAALISIFGTKALKTVWESRFSKKVKKDAFSIKA